MKSCFSAASGWDKMNLVLVAVAVRLTLVFFTLTEVRRKHLPGPQRQLFFEEQKKRLLEIQLNSDFTK